MKQRFISAVIVTMPLLTSGNTYANSSVTSVTDANQSNSLSKNAISQIDNRISIPSNTISRGFLEENGPSFVEWKQEQKNIRIGESSYPQNANTINTFQKYAPIHLS